MNKEIFKYLINNAGTEPIQVNRLIVSTFIDLKQLKSKGNSILSSLTIRQEDPDWSAFNKFKAFLQTYQSDFSFEDLIELFEFVVSPSDKKVNGAIYTPEFIRKYIVEQATESYKKNLSQALVCDVACGCGGFLYTYAQFLHDKISLSYKYIFENLLYGVDITLYSVERSAIILSLLALCNGEDKNFNFNLKVGNSLNFNWKQSFKQVDKQKGFDLILGNPPYVCAKNLSVEARHLLEQWPVSQSGNPDLYIPFFQLALDALNDNGILGYITVNSFTKSVNGRKLRAYFHQNLFGIKIIDFGGEQVFKGRTTYTCICIIQKESSDHIKYRLTSSKDLGNLNDDQFFTIPYDTLTDKKGWILSQGKIIQLLQKLRSSGVALEKVVDMRGGFATLANHIFVFKPQAQTNTHYQLRTKNGKEYWIEKRICRDVVKANSLKNEDDLDIFLEKIIFPYQHQPSNPLMFTDPHSIVVKYKIIIEKDLRDKFPDTHFYLSSFREELNGRDKGNGKYEAWYAYGRTQGLISNGHKLLFPHISDKPYFVYTDRQDLLFYNGFALVSQNYRLLMILQKVLISDVFWFYVKHTSKPYSSNYYGLGKNFIKDFHIPIFTNEEEDFLINCESKEMVNNLLSRKYDITLDVIYSSLAKVGLES